MMRFIYLLVVLALCLAACSDDDSSISNKTVIDVHLEALDKTKDVEQQLMNAAERQDKLIEQ